MREELVPGTDDYYIRDDGTIWRNGCEKKPFLTRGYYMINCNRPQTQKYVGGQMIVSIHRAVAMAFVHNPRPDIFTCVDHINHDRKNNHYTNLRWISANLNRRWKAGLCIRQTQNGKWQSKVCECPTKVCESREAAIEHSRKLKLEKFNKIYFEELKSEPRFKNAAVQTDL
jgi:hypothetical protein